MLQSVRRERPKQQSLSFLRILPELRASQIEDYNKAGRAGHAVYLSRHYDLGSTPIPPEFRAADLRQAFRIVLRSDADTFELPEPVWARYAPHTAVLSLAWRMNRLIRRRPARARLYAIENNDPIVALLGRTVPTPLRSALALLMGFFIRVTYERIAYGSPGARAAYETLPFVKGITSSTIVELPAARQIREEREKPGVEALFVGALDQRKGVPNLLAAWHAVEKRSAEARLTIVGAGPLESEVSRWAAECPSNRTFLGQVEHADLSEVLASARVIVAPSERDGRWREQIGLPIVEGLEHGLTVVTTGETGLADWLREAGHSVVPTPARPDVLAQAIGDALDHPLPRKRVLESLPKQDGRVSAALWLLEP